MSSAQFYIASLNQSVGFDLAATTGDVTALEAATYHTVQEGIADLAKCLAAFRFRTLRTDEGDDNADFIVVGMHKLNDTIFTRKVGTSITTGLNFDNRVANNYLTLLAKHVFGADDAADLLNGRVELQAEWENKALALITQMNTATHSLAAVEIVRTMLAHNSTKSRFYLMDGVTNSVDVCTAGDYVDAEVKCTATGAIALISFTTEGNGTCTKARMQSPAAANGTGVLFAVGDVCTVGKNIPVSQGNLWNSNHYLLTLTDVQRAMLNNEMDVENALVNPALTLVKTSGFDSVNAHYPNCTITVDGVGNPPGAGAGALCEVHTNSAGTVIGILITTAATTPYSGNENTVVTITFDNTVMVVGSVNTITIANVFTAAGTAALNYLNTDPAIALTTGGVACPFKVGDIIRSKHTITSHPAQTDIKNVVIPEWFQSYILDCEIV